LSWRYSEIGLCQFVSEPGYSVIVAISIPGSYALLISLGGVPKSVSEVNVGSPTTGGVPGSGAELCLPGGGLPRVLGYLP
jgi:hypothetical protein